MARWHAQSTDDANARLVLVLGVVRPLRVRTLVRVWEIRQLGPERVGHQQSRLAAAQMQNLRQLSKKC